MRPRRVRDRRMGERAVTLVWQRRRFVCSNSGERHLEEHPEFEGNLTRRLTRQLVADARVMLISAVSRREGMPTSPPPHWSPTGEDSGSDQPAPRRVGRVTPLPDRPLMGIVGRSREAPC